MLDEPLDEPSDATCDEPSDDSHALAGSEGELLSFTVEESSAGQRVDAVLAELSGASRSQVKRWMDDARVVVGGQVVRASRILALGETIAARPTTPVALSLLAEEIPLVVLFEDTDLIVVDKPAGMVVHPAPGHPTGTLVNALLHHCRGQLAGIGGVLRPGIVHRLDRGTSGVLVAAKTDLAHRALAEQFARHSIERIYRTFVRGLPKASAGRIDRPIGRHPDDRQRMSVRTRSGRAAATNWRVLGRDRSQGIAALEIRPETGRTHQIRVHLASAGLPVVGDVVYGRARGEEAVLGRPALHAARLGFDHPRSRERVVFEAPLPTDLQQLEASLDLAPDEAPAPVRGSRK